MIPGFQPRLVSKASACRRSVQPNLAWAAFLEFNTGYSVEERGQAPEVHVQIKPSVPNRFALCARGRGRLANHADRERVEA